jgi:hypothetical protein
VYDEEKKYFILCQLEQPRRKKNLKFRHDKPNEPTNEGPLSFALIESPFSSISKASRVHHALLSGLEETGCIQTGKQTDFFDREASRHTVQMLHGHLDN